MLPPTLGSAHSQNHSNYRLRYHLHPILLFAPILALVPAPAPTAISVSNLIHNASSPLLLIFPSASIQGAASLPALLTSSCKPFRSFSPPRLVPVVLSTSTLLNPFLSLSFPLPLAPSSSDPRAAFPAISIVSAYRPAISS